jgi:hypothetical protein
MTVRCGDAGKRACREKLHHSFQERNSAAPHDNSVVNYLVNDREERARWLAQNSLGLRSQVNKNN